MLTRSDTDLNIQNSSGSTVFTLAAKYKYPNILKLLLAHTPTHVEIKGEYTNEIKKILTNWKLFFPAWRYRELGCKIYPKELKNIAFTWLLVGKRLKWPKDMVHLVLEYVAGAWKWAQDNETSAIEPTKKRIKKDGRK